MVPYWCSKFEGNQSTRRLSLVPLKLFLKRCKEENMKKIGQFSGTNISWTAVLIFLKLCKLGCVYGGHKICKFGRNQLSSYRDIMG